MSEISPPYLAVSVSCGHPHSAAVERAVAVSWRDYTRYGERAVRTGVLCPDCLADYQDAGWLLLTAADEAAWLAGGVGDGQDEDGWVLDLVNYGDAGALLCRL